MFQKITNYILEQDFRINYIDNKLDIINYCNIDHFDNNIIIIQHKNGYLHIKGKHLIISKLENNELLISGQIQSIEFR